MGWPHLWAFVASGILGNLGTVLWWKPWLLGDARIGAWLGTVLVVVAVSIAKESGLMRKLDGEEIG